MLTGEMIILIRSVDSSDVNRVKLSSFYFLRIHAKSAYTMINEGDTQATCFFAREANQPPVTNAPCKCDMLTGGTSKAQKST